MLVLVEGSKTEDGYLLPLRRAVRDKVLLTVDARGGAPFTLVERAVEAKRASARDAARARGRAFEDIWCVFDVDEHPKVPEAIALAQAHGIEVVISNPCIELWFILHFEDQTAAIDRHQAQHRAEELLSCKKNLTDDAIELLYARYADARRRAQALDAKHQGDGSPPRSTPSSDVWRLIEHLRSL